MTLDMKGFESAIVRHCSPTLAGIKPGCLFNVPGVFAADLNEEPAVQLEQWVAAQELCRKLDALIAKLNARLVYSGVQIRAIAHRHCGALIYVWRPDMLNNVLADKRVASRLDEWGYSAYHLLSSTPEKPTYNTDECIACLGARLEECHRKNPNAGFPHEIGFFLGYPYSDVMGFIEHEGQDYLCCGAWKVYSDKDAAEACFEQYRQCTKHYEALLEMGTSITKLATVQTSAA